MVRCNSWKQAACCHHVLCRPSLPGLSWTGRDAGFNEMKYSQLILQAGRSSITPSSFNTRQFESFASAPIFAWRALVIKSCLINSTTYAGSDLFHLSEKLGGNLRNQGGFGVQCRMQLESSRASLDRFIDLFYVRVYN